MRRHAPRAVFVFLSTNKVYGDGPNHVPLRELETRWDYDDPRYEHGIAEEFPVDHCVHSLFGVSKLSADVMVQEYGRYFGLHTGVFRGGCLTGPNHSGVELHGFLNYLVNVAVREGTTRSTDTAGNRFGTKVHSRDVVNAFWHFAQAPRPGEVYNLGGGRDNAASLIECVDRIERLTARRPSLTYCETPRVGDHICYYSDLRKFRSHFPSWSVERSLDDIIDAIVQTQLACEAG